MLQLKTTIKCVRYILGKASSHSTNIFIVTLILNEEKKAWILPNSVYDNKKFWSEFEILKSRYRVGYFTKKSIRFELGLIFMYHWVMKFNQKVLSNFEKRSNFVFCSVWKPGNFNSVRHSRSPYPLYQISL